MTKQVMIDKDKVTMPKLTFTENALKQLNLIIENDFTLAGRYFRLLISGKGCDGFTYASGFTDLLDDDFLVPINGSDTQNPQVAIDPFTAFYLSEASVDYIQDYKQNTEGFVITNHHQKTFHGKFWKDKANLTPPIK